MPPTVHAALLWLPPYLELLLFWLHAGNAFMAELQSRLVPLLVEQEEFWARYFFRCGARTLAEEDCISCVSPCP